MAAPRTSLRESVNPPAVDTTVAWMRSPAATSSTPSAFFNSAISMTASPLPPTSTNATSGPIATIVPSMVCPLSYCVTLTDGFEQGGEIFLGLAHSTLLMMRT